ncbi:MAG: response regulator [Planctomycetaceae bacterium]|nr:response regulator [Planctomycetaceae bacterium]
MPWSALPENDRRVLILMPTRKDAERTSDMLKDAGHACTLCPDLPTLCRQFDRGAGALLLTDEFVLRDPGGHLRQCLAEQPAWSAIPVIVLTRDGSSRHEDLRAAGNVTLVERPVRFRSLISVVDAALRAREQQYQIRDHLELQERQAAALRESENRFRTLVEQVRDYAIFSTDLKGIATTWNEGVERVLGFSEEEFVGVDVTSRIFTPEDVAAGIPERELKEAATHGSAGNDRWMRRKDGSRFFAMGATTGLRDGVGALIGFSKVMRDATDWRNAVDALRQADRQKDEFLAMLAHELRNPLAPIRSGLSLLQLEKPDETLELMQHQVDHLVRLVDDLLDVSRIVQGKIALRVETVDLASVLLRSIDVVRPIIKRQQQEMRVSLPTETIWLRADPVRLTQVVENLLHNASKYTPAGGSIEISAHLNSDGVVIAVKDTGIGIEPDLLPRVFDLFTQSSRALDRAQGGLGIGLTLVRTLVAMHGGHVAADSPGLGMGSTFSVQLPTVPGPTERVAPPRDAESSVPLRVMAVDDNVGAASLLGRLIRKLGNHEVELAHDGPTLLSRVAEFRPDLILLDIGLPGMDGYQVARALRRQAAGRDVMLVALTGYGQDEDRRKSRHAGFDEHVIKPIDIATLRKVLRHPKLAERADARALPVHPDSLTAGPTASDDPS